jgi:putative ABC transport system permease protein
MTWLDRLRQDLRFGARSLARTPGVTGIAVLSLALGIMATTAIYSVIHGVIVDPFPYRDVDRLMSVKVWEPGARGFRTSYSTDQFLEIAERSTIFDGVIASTISDVLWTGEGEPQRLRGNYVTTNTFQVMGVAPLAGRAIAPADGTPGAPEVAVLGHRFWRRQFGGDPGVVGRELRLNGKVRTVVGIMPKRFMWRGADVYLPVVFERGRVVEGVRFVHLLGRLQPGVTEARAETDLRPIIEDLQKREPGQFPEHWRVGLLSFKETFPSSIREALWILLGAVALLLLIACANVSNLLLSKAASRQKEMAVRAALGADRRRLLRQLLTESLLLGLTGGVLGVALAFGALRAILALVPPDTIPDESEIAINAPVLLFTLAVSVLTALVFGLAPALHGSSTDLARPLKAAGRGLGGGAGPKALRQGLVVAEVALSLMLLVGASLMVRTLLAMQSADFGIRTDRVLTMRVPLSEQRYPDAARRAALLRDLLRRVREVPGVVTAGVNTGIHPFGNWSMPVEVAGSERPDTRPVLVHQIDPDYPRVMGIGLRQGRLLQESEVAARQHVALVNQAFVRRYSDGRDPLGRVVRIPRLRTAPFAETDDSFQIVGVVNDTVNRGFADEVWPEVYFPYTITGRADTLAILSQVEPTALAAAIRSEVYAVDKDQPVTQVRTIAAALEEAFLSRSRFNLVLFSVFAALGLALAVIGVYGVISNAVAQQSHEIGVRIALGAGFGDIAGMVIASGLKLLGGGILLGLAGSLAGARLLAQQVWRVSPFDPMSFAAVSLLLLAVGLQACFWPARRAARVDPVTALRYE